MASIKKRTTDRGENRYEVRWRIPGGQAPSKTFERWEDADSFKKKVERDEHAGLITDPRAGMALLEDYVKGWLASRVVAGRPLTAATLQGYEALLRRNIYPTFGKTPLRRITPEQIRKWYSTVSTEASADQAAKSYRLLRAILNTAVEDEAISRNPCRIRGGGIEHADERPMIKTEMVFDLADAIDERLSALVLLAALGGLRTGELLGLRRCDVDLLHRTVRVARQAQEITGRGRIVVEHAKSEAGRRTLTLPLVAIEVLDEHLQRFAQPGSEGFVFTGPEGTPLRRNILSAAWRQACQQVGAPDGLHLHDCRHHAATLIARMPGITLKELMSRIGHSTPRAALIYQHATDERDRAMADFLEAQLANVERKPRAAVSDLYEARTHRTGGPRRRQSRNNV